MERGTYGWCDETGEAIGSARLIAWPTATLTVAAQQRREHRKRFTG
nr:TraR/DksA family transcriptional regulator [Thauera aminoaromatica]